MRKLVVFLLAGLLGTTTATTAAEPLTEAASLRLGLARPELADLAQSALEAEITALELEWKARAARIELDHLTGNYPL